MSLSSYIQRCRLLQQSKESVVNLLVIVDEENMYHVLQALTELQG